MTLMTIISTATPKETPSTEIKVMTETNVLLGRRYRSASSSSNGSRDIEPEARGDGLRCQRSLIPSRIDGDISGAVESSVGSEPGDLEFDASHGDGLRPFFSFGMDSGQEFFCGSKNAATKDDFF